LRRESFLSRKKFLIWKINRKFRNTEEEIGNKIKDQISNYKKIVAELEESR